MLRKALAISIVLVGFAVAIVSLFTVGDARAEVDVAGVDGALLALDEAGRVWLYSGVGPTGECWWHHIETFSGAFAWDWNGTMGTIAFDTAELRVVDFHNTTRTFATFASFTMPSTDIVEVGAGSPPGPYWLKTPAGQFWSLRKIGPDWIWFDPCDGPGVPVTVESESWSRTKAAHR